MARYDFPIPIGWFEVAAIDTLQPGERKEIHAFDQDLVLWRGDDGTYRLQEAYCPHLGANLADGRVVGNEIECPFHDWRFGSDGRVTAIPYAPNAPLKACLRTFPLREFCGLVMAWHHPQDVAPLYELPVIEELADPAIRGPLSETHEINTCVQEMAENGVDAAHFISIHNHDGPAHYESVVFENHTMVVKTLQEFPSSRGTVKGTLDSYSFGMGLGVIRYKTLIDITMVATNTPIDKETTLQRFMVFYKNPTNDDRVDRIAKAFYRSVNDQVRQDIPIWNRKIYRPRPMLTEGEGPITLFRRWVKQFYVEPAKTTEAA